ncbi:MFS transporter [Babesia caballi]|uniref:MFS transporter n=1 Tax=Babesia caballi TaxID=5871 RepID=A0AAV4LLH8_BABCB|nr:MFS transporter [Babesia caballi]
MASVVGGEAVVAEGGRAVGAVDEHVVALRTLAEAETAFVPPTGPRLFGRPQTLANPVVALGAPEAGHELPVVQLNGQAVLVLVAGLVVFRETTAEAPALVANGAGLGALAEAVRHVHGRRTAALAAGTPE